MFSCLEFELEEVCRVLSAVPSWGQEKALWDAVSSLYHRFGTDKNQQLMALYSQLPDVDFHAFGPWRKGPFYLNDTFIDSEWRSDLKWARILPHLPDLSGAKILDLGCGNGYYLLELSKLNPAFCLGLDPTTLFFMQFQLVQWFYQCKRCHVLPLGWEHLSLLPSCFDYVFCMGVLYHHASPEQLLTQLRAVSSETGTLILETLVLSDEDEQILIPKRGRYASMRGISMIPSVPLLKRWLDESGFKEVRLLDLTWTTSEEQRATAWSNSWSFINTLNPENSKETLEGYQAPLRAIIMAKR